MAIRRRSSSILSRARAAASASSSARTGPSTFRIRDCGEWFVSTTRSGARWSTPVSASPPKTPASWCRSCATRRAGRGTQTAAATILVDGPPGIGCPVIASITGATGVLVVTEPTVSGAHDMARVLELAAHFADPCRGVRQSMGLNPEGAERIESRARELGAVIAGRIRYDTAVTKAQVEGRTVVELGGAAADDIRAVWDHVRGLGGGLTTFRWPHLGFAIGGQRNEKDSESSSVIGGGAARAASASAR